MGAWGITMRESDYGLDLLGTVVKAQLKQTDFSVFHVTEAIELLRQDILEEIKRANRGCPPEKLGYYINANFPRDFTHAALLIAECLADYYRTGDLIVTEYVGESYTPVDHHIKNFVVSEGDLKTLPDELRKVQDPEHELYQSWFKEETRQESRSVLISFKDSVPMISRILPWRESWRSRVISSGRLFRKFLAASLMPSAWGRCGPLPRHPH